VGNPTGKNGSARVKLQRQYLDAYLAEFEKSGAAAITILAKEDPAAFLKIGLHFFPREFVIENTMSEFSDEDIDDLIERMRSQVEAERARTIEHKATVAIGSRVGEIGGREGPAPLGAAGEGRGSDAASDRQAGRGRTEGEASGGKAQWQGRELDQADHRPAGLVHGASLEGD
jgi:hypothetical protein